VLLPSPLIEGTLVRRYKRFLADIELAGGEQVTAHCANPGSMKTCAPDGARVWVSTSDDPRRKLRYSWELVESAGAIVCINTQWGNRVVQEALAAGSIPELAGYRTVRPEVRFGEKSRIDFLLSDGDGPDCFVEVKTVTMHGGGRVAAFPDSVTTRGRRHLEELSRAMDEGYRAVLLFLCARDPSDLVVPADHIDPQYGETLRRVAERGVEILAVGCTVTPEAITASHPLEVSLAPQEPLRAQG